MGRLTKDLEEIGEVAHHGPEDLFIAIMTFIGAFLLMLSVNVPLALITAAVVPVTAWVTSRYGGRMTQNFRALYGRVGDFNARIEEMSGVCGWCRPSPMRITRGRCSKRTTRNTAVTKLDA